MLPPVCRCRSAWCLPIFWLYAYRGKEKGSRIVLADVDDAEKGCTIVTSIRSSPPSLPNALMSGLDYSSPRCFGSITGLRHARDSSSASSLTCRLSRVVTLAHPTSDEWAQISRWSPYRSSCAEHPGRGHVTSPRLRIGVRVQYRSHARNWTLLT